MPVVGRFLSPDPYVQAPDFSQNFNRYSYALNNPFRYTDPSGEWFGLDDLIAAAIGGVVNLGVNIWQGNITGTPWEMIGKGAAAFGAGAAADNLALYGPFGWAAGGAIVGATNTALSGANAGEIVTGSVIGTASGLVGGFAGQFAANSLGAVVINGFRITSPVVKGAVGGLLGGAGGGYAGGFTAGYLFTGNIQKAHEFGLSSLKTSAGIGLIAGAGGGYRYAKRHDLDLWTGKWTGKISGNPNFRTTAENLTEQLTLQEAKSGAGIEKMQGSIKDPIWKDWQKMEHAHKTEILSTKIVNEKTYYYYKEQSTTVHYWKNPRTGEVSGFKFK
ncbi:RHS repeat-associated core domain-containing protein [Dysgonomonas macrotermitis]|uniref:RHS repeat-associated core domain-containing protein n=1 Tax=Dysgonomonas macrotermitis TaxID=1346286 RepID=A0A1M4W7D7_9BACT|nr:RHS repeat-associated core domain-containing protein [Dysgonomonas macrotermitis]SHE77178.1 RHS repeat-associated core domain-containing protein [Dysgonomonas macrotermitis]